MAFWSGFGQRLFNLESSKVQFFWAQLAVNLGHFPRGIGHQRGPWFTRFLRILRPRISTKLQKNNVHKSIFHGNMHWPYNILILPSSFPVRLCLEPHNTFCPGEFLRNKNRILRPLMILGDFGLLNCMGNESEIVWVIAEVIVGVFFFRWWMEKIMAMESVGKWFDELGALNAPVNHLWPQTRPNINRESAVFSPNGLQWLQVEMMG